LGLVLRDQPTGQRRDLYHVNFDLRRVSFRRNRRNELQEVPISSALLDFFRRMTMYRSACIRTRRGTDKNGTGYA